MSMTVQILRGHHVRLGLGLGLLALIGAGACGSDDGTLGSVPDPTTPTPTTSAIDGAPSTASTTPEATQSPGTAGSTTDRLVQMAIDDLAVRFDLTEEAVTIVTVDEVTWPDTSLGCPKKGMQYLQVLTPGTRIVLSDGSRTFAYHAGDGRDPFYCARPQSPVPD